MCPILRSGRKIFGAGSEGYIRVSKAQHTYVFARAMRSAPEAIPNFDGDCFAANNAARNDVEIYVVENRF